MNLAQRLVVWRWYPIACGALAFVVCMGAAFALPMWGYLATCAGVPVAIWAFGRIAVDS